MSVAQVLERKSGIIVEKKIVFRGIEYKNPKDVQVNRGEVWLVELDGIGSEQKGVRPAVILSNSKGNRFGTTVIVAAITAQIQKAKLPTHVAVVANEKGGGLQKTSVIMLEQIRTIDKQRLIRKIAELDHETMKRVMIAHEISCADF